MPITDVVVVNDARTVPVELWGAQPNPTDGEPTESGLKAWASPSGNIRAGVWECTAGSFPGRHPETELCYLLAGRVTFQAPGSDPVEASAGSVVVFPAGWEGTWTIHETVRKVYIIGALT